MVDLIKHYLVDSENVNDNWLMLLDMAEPEDEIVVFYTKNSPHMSYSSVIRLLESDRKVKFEECHEGNNGLDFQLISYMGFMMKEDEADGDEYIIMSNDTGFDAAVNFWKDRNFPVKRINVNYCKQHSRQKISDTSDESVENDAASASQDADVPQVQEADVQKPAAEKPAVKAPAAKSSQKTQYNFNKEEVDIFINCIGKSNLTAIHETLVHVYGQKQAQSIYKTVKEKSYPLEEKQYERKDKVKHFSDIIFSHSDLKKPDNFVDFLEKNKDKTKNLNGIRAAIVKSYGESNGMKYYSLFKPYFKIISALK